MSDLLIRRESTTAWTLRLLLGDEPVALGDVCRTGDRYSAALADGTPVTDVETGATDFDSLRHAAEEVVYAYHERAQQLFRGVTEAIVDTHRVGMILGAVITEEPDLITEEPDLIADE